MESLLNSIEQSDSDHDSDEDSDENEASMEIELQAPRAKSSSKVGTKSRKRQTNTKRRPVRLLDINCGSQVYAYTINFISNLCRLQRRDVNVKITGLQRSSLTC